MEKEVRAAREARGVVLFAHREGTEGSSRPALSLPGHRDELVPRVATSKPRTVVVLTTGAPVLMPWT